ncbi:E3 SUMO-protein ligase PIAS1-like [Chironomus tepperi]|uniref:E3 SUMO-protein ligase PIAS1-like n=1 Tax=Chironomus tepperi TaxID=113505 RepID=UPI00391FA82A
MKRFRSSDYEELNELKRKIVILKIQDLQIILGQFNISKSGRKSELQDRLISLLKNGSLKDDQRRELSEKINEISSKLKQLSINMSSKNEVESNKRLKTLSTVDSTRSLQVQPVVKFKKIPFYDHLAVLLEPSILTPNNSSSEQIKCFIFNLTDQQAGVFEENIIKDGINVIYNVQVLFRICLVDPSEQNDLFPLNFQLRVNNRICQLPPFLPSRPNTIPKRASKPLNISNMIKSAITNIVEVRWHRETEKNFAVSCFLVRKLSSNNLLERLKIQAESLTRGMIKDKLGKEVDSEIATTMLRVSLICPLGKIRMKMPCRASTCKHLQCFDALLYLQMNECKQSWICPVCDKEAIFDNLSIDGYFLNIIKSLDVHDNEIQLHKDGSWSKLEKKVETVQKYEGFVISDDEDTNNNKPASIIKDEQKLVKMKRPTHISKKIKIAGPIDISETIDLTLDD